LIFDNESLEEIAAKLERWYNVKITISGQSIENIASPVLLKMKQLSRLYLLCKSSNLSTLKSMKMT
jgi:hypothetical protein